MTNGERNNPLRPELTPAHPVLGESPGRTPLQTFLRTWRNLAIASIGLSWMLCVAATVEGGPRWYAWLVLPAVCLAGPFSLLLLNLQAAPVVAVCVVFYGLGVAWLFRKPSRWARAVFIGLSVLWLLLGLSVAGVGM